MRGRRGPATAGHCNCWLHSDGTAPTGPGSSLKGAPDLDSQRITMLRLFSPLTVALAAVPLATSLVVAQGPIEVKVVVVTMFERGADTGDQPGEFQRWVEREPLDQVVPFPQGWRDLRMNKNGVFGLCTGVGTAKAAASVMALGLDPRFDL